MLTLALAIYAAVMGTIALVITIHRLRRQRRRGGTLPAADRRFYDATVELRRVPEGRGVGEGRSPDGAS